MGIRETHTTAPATRGKESRMPSPFWFLALAVSGEDEDDGRRKGKAKSLGP
jgi:hypothetical protein